jgi:hypothetical protein
VLARGDDPPEPPAWHSVLLWLGADGRILLWLGADGRILLWLGADGRVADGLVLFWVALWPG